MKKIIQFGAISALIFTAAAAQAEIAQIISLTGNAVVERDSHKYFAQRGMVLEQGDVVRSLQNGKVKLKYSNCISYVESGKEVEVSKAEPCAPAKVAKASDLNAPATKNYKIQRIDSNLAEANCNACKVDLASGAAVAALPSLSGGALLPVAGLGGLAALAKNGGGSSTPAAAEEPVAETPADQPETPVDQPETPVDQPETPVDQPETPEDTGSNNPVSPM